MKSPFTRQIPVHSLYGYPAEMATNVLPTAREVACHFLLSKDRPSESNINAIETTVDAILTIWNATKVNVSRCRKSH